MTTTNALFDKEYVTAALRYGETPQGRDFRRNWHDTTMVNVVVVKYKRCKCINKGIMRCEHGDVGIDRIPKYYNGKEQNLEEKNTSLGFTKNFADYEKALEYAKLINKELGMMSI